MSKRQASASHSSSSKRARKHGFASAVPEDENPFGFQPTAPSSTSFSIRTLPSNDTPSLATLCIRAFVANIQFLFSDQRKDMTQYWLKSLPETIVPRLFAMLSNAHPTLLSHGLIVAYFLRGNPIILSGSMPGVSSLTIQALAKTDTSFRECRLTDVDKVPDDIFANLFSELPMCETLILKRSIKVGKKSVDAIANTCKRLRKLNLNFTSAPPSSIAYLTGQCLELDVLKLAGMHLINDNTFSDILHILEDDRPLQQLTRLKLRHTSITEQSLKRIGSRCIHLKHLDVSFTPIKQPTVLLDSDVFIPELEKLSLTSTPLTSAFLLKITISDSRFPLKSLRTLHIGAIGGSPSSRIRNTPDSLTLTDGMLDLLTDSLYDCKLLENISLVGNSKLGLRSKSHSSLARFIRMVGRCCKLLNLAAISRLTSSDLSGLPPIGAITNEDASEDLTAYEPSPLHTLNLNNTDVGDEAATYIATCPNLRILNIASTKFDYTSLFFIVDACEHLTTLDLTSCRNITIADRRRFFEVWQDHRRTGR